MGKKTTRKTTRKPRAYKPMPQWNFYLSNGEALGPLTFTKAQLRRWFPDARIDGACVYL